VLPVTDDYVGGKPVTRIRRGDRKAVRLLTVNAFALLGLRDPFFLVKGLLDRLVYLSLGLSIMLGDRRLSARAGRRQVWSHWSSCTQKYDRTGWVDLAHQGTKINITSATYQDLTDVFPSRGRTSR
jgi:hypothetical protein